MKSSLYETVGGCRGLWNRFLGFCSIRFVVPRHLVPLAHPHVLTFMLQWCCSIMCLHWSVLICFKVITYSERGTFNRWTLYFTRGRIYLFYIWIYFEITNAREAHFIFNISFALNPTHYLNTETHTYFIRISLKIHPRHLVVSLALCMKWSSYLPHSLTFLYEHIPRKSFIMLL